MGSHAQTAALPGSGNQAAPASAAIRRRPFCQSAKHGSELGPTFSFTPGAAAVALGNGPTPLPATGYLRRILLETIASGGVGAATGAGDYPFNIYNLIRLTEPNGAPIFELSGYNTLLSNVYGGYAGVNDPRNDPDFSNNADNPNIEPFIPLELDPSGMGALANLSASSAFRLTLIGEAKTAIWTSPPATTIPTFAIQAIDDYWTLPNADDGQGGSQETAPPYPGTIQLWSQLLNLTLNTGNQRTQLERMGNQLRTVIIGTRVSGVRSDTPFPNPTTLRWDDLNLRNETPQSIRKKMREYVNGLTARDVGVYVFPYSYGVSRFVGGNGVSSYLPTVTATRYELSGASGGAGTLDWVINDVSSAAVSGVQRATVGGAGLQYHAPNPSPSYAG